MSELKAIETVYKGYRFRSRLEARWAVFFDAMGIEWEYEKEGYELEGGVRYLPDFWLPKQEVFVEIKGIAPTAEECNKCYLLSKQSGFKVLMFQGFLDFDEDLMSQYGVFTLSCEGYIFRGDFDSKWAKEDPFIRNLQIDEDAYFVKEELMKIDSSIVAGDYDSTQNIVKLLSADREYRRRRVPPGNKAVVWNWLYQYGSARYFTYQDSFDSWEDNLANLSPISKHSVYRLAITKAKSARFEFNDKQN